MRKGRYAWEPGWYVQHRNWELGCKPRSWRWFVKRGHPRLPSGFAPVFRMRLSMQMGPICFLWVYGL